MKVPPFQALILAAGQGTRMKSETIKVLHDLLGEPLLGHVIGGALKSGAGRIVTIVGHQREAVEAYLSGHDASARLEVAEQVERRGTADAVWAARPFLEDREFEYTAILSGDVPTMPGETLERFFRETMESGAAVGLVTAVLEDPSRYGRILRGEAGVEAIVEYKDASEEEREISEINGGVYFVRTEFLASALSTIMGRPADNAQNEYYLTDIVALAREQGEKVFGHVVEDERFIQGVNTRADLAGAVAILRERINRGWMDAGVTFLAPDQTFVEPTVELAQDVTLFPGVYLGGKTTVGPGAVVESGSMIRDSEVGAEVTVKAHCYLTEARVERGSSVGPFAHLRPGADVGPGCKVGNFVEVKKTRMEAGSKASHLTYLGDAHVGEGANVGAGTITCNYDGAKKSRTEIGPGAFIGSNTALVAPVKVGKGAYVGAGSVITEDVPDKALGIARGRQRNIPGYGDK